MNLLTRILDFISPRQCVVCGRRLAPTERSLCSVCMLHLPLTNYQYAADDNPMVQLFWHLTSVQRAAALFFYEPHSEIAQLVYDLKYNNRPDIGEDMGRMMATEMQHGNFFDGIDLLVPVPLANKRKRQRGYNQSEMLARGISEKTHIPIVRNHLLRRHFKESQTHLTRYERQENVADVFAVKDADFFKQKHILLIDDICTTGATLIACANTLKEIEGIRISVLTLGFTKS